MHSLCNKTLELRRESPVFQISFCLIAALATGTAMAQTFTTATQQRVNTFVGQTAGAAFRFTNSSSIPLIIQNVSVSNLHCLVRFTRKPILPQKSGAIYLNCTQTETGYFNKSALATFSSGKTIRLSVSGETAEADPCSPIQLDAPGGAMEKIVKAMPVISQTGGSCSFQTAVQLFDAWRDRYENFDPKKLSSPMELNFRKHHQDQVPTLDGGLIQNNLALLAKEGACPRNYFNPQTGVDADELFYDILSENFQKEQDLASALRFVKKLYAKKAIYRLNASLSFSAAAADLKKKDFVSFISKVVPPQCSESEKLKNYRPYRIVNHTLEKSIFGYQWHNSEPAKKEINAELNKGLYRAMPIAIAYCSSVLAVGRSFAEIKSSNDSNCGNHASSIIGRRRNPKGGACQFLIRNSWSETTCYNNDWQCVANKSHVWVDADTISNAIYRTTRLEEKN
jgi:hypothetical protein